MRLWLVRHGETQANADGLYSGITPTPLTERGIRHAAQVGEMLQAVTFDHIFCSELERAILTANLLLKPRTFTLHTSPLLNEMYFGDWEMRHHRDLQVEDNERYTAWCADWQNVAPGNGEKFADFSLRVASFIDQLGRFPTINNMLVVSHQGVLSLLIARLLGMPADSLWHFRLDQGAWSAIDVNDGYATLRVLNSRAVWQPEQR